VKKPKAPTAPKRRKVPKAVPPKSARAKALLPLSIFLVLAGCVDLSEVGKFATISESAKTSFPALVADIQNSCIRRANFAPERTREDVLQHCGNLATSKDGLLQAQQVLLNYMEALKNLSSDSSLTYGEKLDSLPDTLSKSGLGDSQVKATTGLAKKLVDAAINGYRKKEIGKLVGQTNDDIQTLTGALKNVVTDGYGNELKLEEEAMNTFYETNIHEYADKEPLTVTLVKRNWTTDLAALQTKKDAAAAYAKTMDSIADGHKKLYDSRNKWSTASLVKDLSSDISDLYQSTEQVYKAFK